MSKEMALFLVVLSILVGSSTAVYLTNPVPPLELKRCGYLKYKIPENTFMDQTDGNTRHLTLSLRNVTGEVVKSNWLAFSPESQTLTAVLTSKTFQGVEQQYKLYFHLHATTKRGESAFATIQLNLMEPWKNTTVEFLVNIVWDAEFTPPLPVILGTFMDRFSAYTGEESSGLRFTHVSQVRNEIHLRITNCTTGKDTCSSEGVKIIKKKLYNEKGTQPQFREFMQPQIHVTYIQLAFDKVCQPSQPPRVLKSYPPITLTPCTTFSNKIPYDVFYDEVDGYNLQLEAIAIDGKPQDRNTAWLYINSGENALYGVVTDKTIREQPQHGYNVTVRAKNSQYRWAETFMIVKIDRTPIQRYYQFTLHLSLIGNTYLAPIIEKNKIVNLLNQYFKSNVSNVMAYNITNSKDIKLRSSICTLPMKCDNSSFTQIWNQLVTSGSTPQTGLKTLFSIRYVIRAVTTFIDPICLQALDPPAPAIDPWIVPITRCGGFTEKIPADLFYDKQDGNTRNLKLQLLTSEGRAIPKASWVQLNASNQMLHGLPTEEDIDAYNSASQQYYKLVATDRSGLNASLQLRFAIQAAPPSTYTYTILYEQSGFQNNLAELYSFKAKLRNYLGYKLHPSLGIKRIARDAPKRIEYMNCSSLFDPCDVKEVAHVNSRLVGDDKYPTDAFKSAMKPEFTILMLNFENTTDCHANTPPRVLNPIRTLAISICGISRYTLPGHVFYDKQDGYTKSLTLKIVDSNNNTLTKNSWLQLNHTTLAITFAATVSLGVTAERQTFTLIATDSGGLTASTQIFTSINGPLQVLKDCQIRVKFQVGASLTGKDDVYLTQYIVSSMQAYFQFKSTKEVGLVSVVRESAESITVSWSYCSSTYVSYTKSYQKHQMINNEVDFRGLASVLSMVFEQNTFHVKAGFKSAFAGMSVLSVMRIFTGKCSSFPPAIGFNRSGLVFNVTDCGNTKIPVGKNWFFDLEDGDAHQLNLQFLDKNNKTITDPTHWINFDKSSRNILILITDKERKQGISTGTFYIVATDSSGLSTKQTLTIHIEKAVKEEPKFNFHFYFINKNIKSNLNDSVSISDKIAEAFSLTSGRDVLINSYREDKGYVDSSILTWSSCYQTSCASNTLQQMKNYLQSGTLFNSLKSRFIPSFDLQRASFYQNCGGTATPPTAQVTQLTFTVSTCGVSVLKLPSTLFSDPSEGPTRNLNIYLLDESKKHVQDTSWIQLNAATLQLYAIPSYEAQLQRKISKFHVSGVNSQNLSKTVSVDVDVTERPYTNDCPVTIVFKRKYSTVHVVDLGVLHHFLTHMSNFYNENQVKMKVLQYKKLNTKTYSLKYSNCSFTFSTKEEARKGYSESFRSTIDQIFFRIANRDGSMNKAFLQFMSKYFEIISIKISYECIEHPPYPTIGKIHRTYALTCSEFTDSHSRAMFNDARDGTNLKYSMTYVSGEPISPSDWVAFDETRMMVYGMVTEEVKLRAPFLGYEYRIVATDSSGRSANITYLIKIASALPHLPFKFDLAFESSFNQTVPTAMVLTSMARKIAAYVYGTARGDDIMITSYTAGKSIAFGLCSLACSQIDYLRVAAKLQATVYYPAPAASFVTASSGSFVPKKIYIDGASCLPSSSLTVITTRVIIINWQNVCGYVEYKIPGDTFKGSSSHATNDFFLAMRYHGQPLSSASPYNFDVGYQSFYGLVVASTAMEKRIYDLQAKHPTSGHMSHTSLTLNIQDHEKFHAASKSLCVITVAFTTQFNPAYSDFHIVKAFMNKLAMYLKTTVQEVQIVSYSRIKQYPVQMSVSFANCKWYSWINAASSSVMLQQYTRSRDEALQKCFASLSQQVAFSAAFSQAMMPDFKLATVSSNSWCKRPPNKPPTANMTVIRITVRPCTMFTKQIPEEAFVDEDGNTRSLTLGLYHSDGSILTASDWISFNAATQYASGTPTRQAQSSDNGVYQYILQATDKYGLSTNSTLSVQITGSAPGNENPRILIENYRVTLGKCGVYRQALPGNFATDKEDGTMRNLRVELKMANGSSLSRDSWVQFDSKTYEIYSLTESGSSRSEYFRVVVTDSCGGMATTQIQITAETSQGAYYSHLFQLQSLLGSNVAFLDIQVKFLALVSKYFGGLSEQYRRTVFVKINSSEFYTFGFTNCSTSEYVCKITDKDYNTKQTIFKESVSNMNSFATFISSSFRITSYQNSSSYKVDLPPSNRSSVMTDFEVKSCGGYSRDMSRGYFEDKEFPTNVRYSMTLKDGLSVPLNSPLQLQGNLLSIVPMGSKSNGVYQVRITSIDKCNQSSYRDLRITINIPVSSPGYQIKFQATVTTNYPAIYYINQFKESFYSHIVNKNYGIAISSFSKVQSSVNIVWSSCNEISQRCNKTDITNLHLKLFTSTNATDPSLVSRLRANFSNPRLTEYYKNCNFSSPEPPISRKPVNIVVDLCRKAEFRIPVDVFNDPEDGNTRNLHLSLLTSNNLRVPDNHWLQFNRKFQQIYGYPRYASKSAFQSTFEYVLVARDIQGNQASTKVTATIEGSTEITYKLTMNGRLPTHYHKPNVDIEIMLIKRIGQFFGDSAINEISFTRSGNAFTFSWSFCRMSTSICNCFYIKHVETRLLNIQAFKKSLGPEFTVEKVTSVRYGVCNRTSTPRVLIDQGNVYINSGQFFNSFISSKQYYDLEDGYTQNLTMLLTDSSSKVVTSSHWIKVERQHICGIVLLSQARSSEWTNSNRQYSLVARDACGKEVRDSFSVVMSTHREYLSYTIRMYFADSYESINTNCSKMQRFVTLVSTYLNINSSDVFIQDMYVQNMTPNYTSSYNNFTVVVWGTRNLTTKNCKNETVKSFRESFVYQNGSTKKAFYQFMKSDFDVVKVDDDNAKCGNATAVPLFIPPKKAHFDFPLWILILLLILVFLILLCWCCWLCIPRCCAGCCVGCVEKHCACCRTLCGKCCIPGGKYASLDEEVLVPDGEQGVLSNARTIPDPEGDKFGMEAAPEDDDSGVMANSGSEPDSIPSKIDEEEVKMDHEEMPNYYTAPDYFASKAAPAGKIVDDFDQDAPAQGSVPLPGDEEPVTSGAAPMPFEEPEEEPNPTRSEEDESSFGSTRNLIREEVMAANELPDTQQSSFQEEYHVESQSQSSSLAEGRCLALPTMPNVYSEHAAEAGEAMEPSAVTSQSTTSRERIFSTGSRESIEDRRASVAQPARLFLPRQSITSVSDVGLHEANNNMLSNSNRRESQMMLLDHDQADGSNYQGRRESRVIIRSSQDNREARRGSAIHLLSSDGSLVGDEPIRLKMSGDGTIQNLLPWQRSAQEMQTTRRVSRISNEFSSAGHRDHMDDNDVAIIRRASTSNFNSGQGYRGSSSDLPAARRMSRVSVSSRRASLASRPYDYDDYGRYDDVSGSRRVSVANRRISNAVPQSLQSRRASREIRKSSLQQPIKSVFTEGSRRLDESQMSRRGSTHFLGYESDSTDSGYAITRQSKRYRGHSRDRSQYRSQEYLDQGGGQRKSSVQVKRKSITSISNGGTQFRRPSRSHALSNDVEMWSRDHQMNNNMGYESDSFV